jgi:hypothetical protein
MKSKLNDTLTGWLHNYLSLLVTIFLAVSLSSCNEKDPSYEKEALKLTAENATLKVQLEEAQRSISSLEAKVRDNQSALDSAKLQLSKSQLKKDSGKIDKDKIKLGFAKAVSELGAQIEEKHPDFTVESVTFQKMQLPTDYPFSSGVMTTLVSKKTGKQQILYWEAQGDTQGVWHFANKEKPVNSNSSTPSTPPSTAAQTPAPQKPTKPIQPTARRPIAADGNTHIIDWGNLQ